jgi:hypothetical protein
MFPSSSPLPASLPPASGHLYGWVDTSVPGHRTLSETTTPSTFTVADGYYRGDELAAALTTAGLSASYETDPGLFRLAPGSTKILASTDRLGVLLGFFARAGQTLPAATGVMTAYRVSPVAIPLLGAVWDAVTIDADDALQMSRAQRASGYVWGAVRVWDVTLMMHRWSFEALGVGWCTRGKVTVVCGSDTLMSSSETGGKIEGHVLSVSRPVWSSTVELQATVTMRIAEVTA